MEGWTPDGGWVKSKTLGCGYDKLSCVVADFLNSSPMIIAKMQELAAWDRDDRPYGFRSREDGTLRAEQAVGTSSIIDGLRAIGITVTHTKGSTSDHLTFTSDWAPRKSIMFYECAYTYVDGSLSKPSKFSIDEYNARPRDKYVVLRKFTRKVKVPKGERETDK